MVYVCTENDNGVLVWMDEDSSIKLLALRKDTADKKVADEAAERKAADEAAAAEQQRINDEAAAAEAQRMADELAAAEAQRQAEEQARQQAVPEPVPAVPAPAPAPAPPAPAAYYPNCSAARAAGAAPVYAGGPGYGPHLDRDGDGVGCE